jgi:XTP/dITP diphosphohydrolase
VLSDDSGISVEALGNAPGIYSARYAGEGATDKDNLNKLVTALKEKGLKESPAFYTAAISIVCREGAYTVHGWMHGKVIDTPRGDGGFGYDPMFIPEGFEQTLGELDAEIKKKISHRSKALALAKVVLSTIEKARH